MFAAKEREKNRKYPHHSIQEIKKEKSSKGNNDFPKERHVFPQRKDMNTSRRKIPQRFVVFPHVSPRQKMAGGVT